MKFAAFPFLITLSIASAASADPPKPGAQSPMAWAFGNTFKIEVPGAGYSALRHVEADGTWMEQSTLAQSRGTWRIDNQEVCYVQTDPPASGYPPLCYDTNPRKPGESWSNTDPVTHNQVTVTLLAGR